MHNQLNNLNHWHIPITFVDWIGINWLHVQNSMKWKPCLKTKGNQNVEKKHVADVKVTITFMNMVDVHVTTTRSKNFETQEFKDKEPLKNKNATYWEIDN